MKKKLLEIKSLKKLYHNSNNETLAIDDLNLEIYENEIVAIVGPSGWENLHYYQFCLT